MTYIPVPGTKLERSVFVNREGLSKSLPAYLYCNEPWTEDRLLDFQRHDELIMNAVCLIWLEKREVVGNGIPVGRVFRHSFSSPISGTLYFFEENWERENAEGVSRDSGSRDSLSEG